MIMNGKYEGPAYWGVWLVSGALFAWIYYIFPLVADDLAFLGFWEQRDAPGQSHTLEGWMAFAEYVRSTDNSRLCNLLAPVWVIYLPQWLRAVTAALITLSTFSVMGRMSNGSGGWRMLALIVALGVVLLPWRDLLPVNDYCLNYVYSGLMNLVFLGYMTSALGTPRGKWGWGAMMALAVVCGAWTEVFAVPTIAGLLCVAMQKRGRMPWAWWVCMALISVAVVAFGWSPGSVGRAERQFFVFTDGYLWHILMRQPTVILLLGGLLLTYPLPRMRRWWNRELHTPLMTALLVITAVGFFLTCMLVTGARASYWPIVASMVIILHLLQPVMGRIRRGVKNGVAVLLIASTWGLMLAQIPTIEAYRAQSEQLMEGIGNEELPVMLRYHNFEEEKRWRSLFIQRGLWPSQLMKGCYEEYFPGREVIWEGDSAILVKPQP